MTAVHHTCQIRIARGIFNFPKGFVCVFSSRLDVSRFFKQSGHDGMSTAVERESRDYAGIFAQHISTKVCHIK